MACENMLLRYYKLFRLSTLPFIAPYVTQALLGTDDGKVEESIERFSYRRFFLVYKGSSLFCLSRSSGPPFLCLFLLVQLFRMGTLRTQIEIFIE